MRTPKTSGHAPVNGIQMYYEIHGEGQIPLVLIHGGGSTIESNFGRILPLFAATHKVIAMELQAHGRTSDRDAPESFEQDADDVAALLQYLGVEKANILGFSNGGTTTLNIALRHPKLVNKIIPIACNYRREGMMDGFFEGMQHATIDNMPRPLQEAFLDVTPDHDLLLNMFTKDRDRMISFIDMADDQLRRIKAPALFMVGDRDVMSVAHVLKMSQLVEGVRLVVLPGFHGEMVGEVCSAPGSNQPAICAALINDFLASNLHSRQPLL
ncbi:MAG: alpha/beta hydrolase [Bacteroidetes bacterium]|nr:alpha/beta hydrolase [Bacteroidota bacterium]